MGKRCFDINRYDEYVKKYKELSLKRNKTISHSELRQPEFDLPDARWLIINCPDKSVDTWSKFVDWCGFFSRNGTLTKEKAIQMIYKMAESMDRPLMYDDFRGTGCYRVPFTYISKFWGTMNDMKKDLGLEIVQESMTDKHLNKDEFIKHIEYIAKCAKAESDSFITTKMIDSDSRFINSSTVRSMCKKYLQATPTEVFSRYGVKCGETGKGLCFNFADGERTTSQFEYMFSNYLRNYGLIFNKDYFRDKRYSEIDPNYTGMMNCDYIINYNGKTIYVEIAGVLDDYKTWYYENQKISSSKSKEKYRIKLSEKEKILKNNNLTYFILFPCDLTRDIFMSILDNPTDELRKSIETFYKNNIYWTKIKQIGELKYNDEIKCGHNTVNYEGVAVV